MGMWIGMGRKARRCYGFDEIALAPGLETVNPAEVDIKWKLRDMEFELPIIASAMDGVVDVKFAAEMSRQGGLAVLNLEGVQTRYENADEVLDRIVGASAEEATELVQTVYKEPVKEELISLRIEQIKKAGGTAVVSSIPQKARRFCEISESAGADIFVVQSTVTTRKHVSSMYSCLDFESLCKKSNLPIIVGNCVSYNVALDLMETGVDGILVGIGPGAACTTRGVLGIGVPQVTATVDCAAARDFYFKKTTRYVSVITDGGMVSGGDICKAFACGADAVMVGSAFARAEEAPGRGFHWGMATPDVNLPRGTRIKVGSSGALKEILYGPARVDDGSQNLAGALRTSMGSLGVKDIKEMQLTEIIIAPSIRTEGKIFQAAQKLGMGK
jgi:IMP dehydrogenase